MNYYKDFDKKLVKNVLKRCIVDPICERYLSGQNMEIEKYTCSEGTLAKLNKLILQVINHSGMTNNLLDWMNEPISDYIAMLEKHKLLPDDIPLLKEASRKCQMIDDQFDYFRRDIVCEFFKNK